MPRTAIDSTVLAGLCRVALDTLPRPTVVCDLEKILYANSAAVDVLRAGSADELVGLDLGELMHADMQTSGEIRRHLITESYQPILGLPAKLVARDGSIFATIVDARPIVFDGQVAIVYSATTTLGARS